MKAQFAVAVALATLFMTGCSDEAEDQDTGSKAPPGVTLTSEPSPGSRPGDKTADAAQEVVLAYNAAFAAGDGAAACAFLTPAYRKEQVAAGAELLNPPPKTCPEAIKDGLAVAKALGYDPNDSAVGRAKVNSDTATVVDISSSGDWVDTKYILTWSDDRWLIASDRRVE